MLQKWKPYPAYKPSGVDWLGEVPAHWEVKRVKQIARLLYGDPLAMEGRQDGEVPVYGSNGIVGYHSAANTRGPALIIGRKGSYGKVNYTESASFSIDTTYFIDERTCSEHLRWLFYGLQILGLDAYSEDSAVPGLSREYVYGRTLPIPLLGEQGAIAAFLDRETAKIDALVAKKERLIELLQEKRSALITHAVTKGLDPSTPMKDSATEWLNQVPAHWEVKRLMFLSPDHRPIMYGIVLPGPNVDDGVPIVKGGDVAPGRLRLDSLSRTTQEIEAAYTRSRLKGGDIVYAIRGSFGAAELVPSELEGANLTQDAARIAPRPGVESRWLLFALKSMSTFAQLDAGAMGAAVRGINIRDLKRAVIPVPSANEQAEVASFLDREAARIDELLTKVQDHMERLREYRVALISAAVTGKIDVREEAA